MEKPILLASVELGTYLALAILIKKAKKFGLLGIISVYVTYLGFNEPDSGGMHMLLFAVFVNLVYSLFVDKIPDEQVFAFASVMLAYFNIWMPVVAGINDLYKTIPFWTFLATGLFSVCMCIRKWGSMRKAQEEELATRKKEEAIRIAVEWIGITRSRAANFITVWGFSPTEKVLDAIDAAEAEKGEVLTPEEKHDIRERVIQRYEEKPCIVSL
jgi:hypothetical protein